MDTKDRQLLYALDRDARASYNELARAARISPETARYRFHRLSEQGVIAKCLTIINTSALGYAYYEIYLRLRKIDVRRRDVLMQFLAQHQNVAWLGQFEGPYDLGFIVLVRSHEELAAIFGQLHERFGAFILRRSISINVRGEFLARDYLIGKRRIIPRASMYRAAAQNIPLDEIDTLICRMLARDARTSAVAIGTATGLTGEAVSARIKRLQRDGVIGGTTLVLGNGPLGQLHYKVLLSLSDGTLNAQQAVVGFLKQHEHVFAIVTTLGDWDIEFDIEIPAVQHVQELLSQLTDAHADRIRDYELIRVIAMPTFNFFPG